MDDAFIGITEGDAGMNLFIGRNLKLFFRDKSAVFFSLLAVFIIIGLYRFFLGDAWVPRDMQDLRIHSFS